MSQGSWIWYQNELIPRQSVHISPDDRGYYFGDGLYEVFRVYSGSMFEPSAHFDRLERTAKALRITLPHSRSQIAARLEELIRKNDLQTGNIYMQITRGIAARSHPFPPLAEPVLMAYTTEADRPQEDMRKGIQAITAEDIRWLRCDLKTLNLLPNVLAKQEALDRGADEVIFHRSGTVTECSASNVMIVKNGVLRTHPANHLILHGVTRLVVLRLARQLGIQVVEEPFTLEALAQADEVFLTSTTAEIMPIVRIDERLVRNGAPGPVTQQLQSAFEAVIPGHAASSDHG
ncbi:D-alanine transaminase [Paenibacillus sp. UNCCL117]|uniref:D-amino-acid transaminase n=1 Tax=unclassified Paenibacillus TaxID=185978 RepID=UPI000889E070|nr:MULTISPECIES: D-amino-acid transaminase [unclassified Paenibacillus]SDC25943.1 D-alanine transaminase [Paenibacillus sp. cl123]SFW19953.1 D-alanine transaminase [Paenibacillus sp. UNCCL117]